MTYLLTFFLRRESLSRCRLFCLCPLCNEEFSGGMSRKKPSGCNGHAFESLPAVRARWLPNSYQGGTDATINQRENTAKEAPTGMLLVFLAIVETGMTGMPLVLQVLLLRSRTTSTSPLPLIPQVIEAGGGR